MEFDHDTLADRLEALGAFSDPCPICEALAFRIPRQYYILTRTDDPEKASFQSTPGSGADVTVNIEGVTMLPLICGTCGFTRLFHLPTLLEEPEPEDSDAPR